VPLVQIEGTATGKTGPRGWLEPPPEAPCQRISIHLPEPAPWWRRAAAPEGSWRRWAATPSRRKTDEPGNRGFGPGRAPQDNPLSMGGKLWDIPNGATAVKVAATDRSGGRSHISVKKHRLAVVQDRGCAIPTAQAETAPIAARRLAALARRWCGRSVVSAQRSAAVALC
jgi:hypothetical protein